MLLTAIQSKCKKTIGTIHNPNTKIVAPDIHMPYKR